MKMKRAASFIDGAEDFIYLCGLPLVNFGSVIILGIVQSARQTSTVVSSHDSQLAGEKENILVSEACRDRTINTSRDESRSISHFDRTADLNGERNECPRVTHEAKDLRPERWPQNPIPSSNKWVTPRWPSRTKEADEREELRAQIRDMKVDASKDPGILSWSEVAGLDRAKVCLEEFSASFLHFPHLVATLRHQSVSGILLFGPQGTGKTLLAKAFAKEYKFAFYDVRASAIMSKYIGDSEKFIKALFEEISANAPAVLLLDECDGLLCNPARDAATSQSYRLLQNELKNQWSDLIYSKSAVVVIGATNKPHDIDMDGFGRRLSLKLPVGLPNQQAAQTILKGALTKVRSWVQDDEFENLGLFCVQHGLSGFDIDCVVEGLVRKRLRQIMISRHFKEFTWQGEVLMMPCSETEDGADELSWHSFEDKTVLSYRPFVYNDVATAIGKARPTVDSEMLMRHEDFAARFGTEEDNDL